MAVSFVGLEAGFTTNTNPVTGLGGIAGGQQDDVALVHLAEFGANASQNLVIDPTTGWTELNSGNPIVEDGDGTENHKHYFGTATRGASAFNVAVDSTNGDYHVAMLALFRDADEPTVYATARRDDHTNSVVIPAFNVADAGSMAFMAVTGYDSDVGTTPFTNEGWTAQGSNDGNWTRYFTKAVSANQTQATTTETDVTSWVCVVCVIPPTATGGPQTWTGTTATIELAGSSGSFVAGAVTWAGSTAVIEAAATSGTFVYDQTWTGTATTIEVAATSGTFTPGTATWTGSTAVIELAATSGSFAAGTATWVGTAAVIEVVATSGTFVAGAVTWVGSTAVIELAATSGSFTAGAATWTGTTAVIELVATSGTFVPGPATWTGSTAVVELAATSGSFVGGGGSQTWTGTAAVIELVAVSARLVPWDLRLVSKSDDQVVMEWDGVWGAQTYEVERTPPGTIVQTGITDTTWTDNTVSPSTTYDYRVRARFAP